MTPKTSLFFEHVRRFWRSHTALKPRVVVAVSGGVDSRLLLEFAVWLKSLGEVESVRAVGVHHQTRSEQDQEMELMQRAALNLGVEWTTLKRRGPAPTSNIEAVLRSDRLQLLKQNLHNEELWLGHHLDDSWEWSMLQMARSSEVQSSLGIPLKNGPCWRPFLCVTRAQIEQEARTRLLVWRDDPSNMDPRYARTYFRHQLHPQLKAQHPQFLKHYARRSQRLAEKLGVALKAQKSGHAFHHPMASLLAGDVSENELVEAVKRLSGVARGTLTREVSKVLQAVKNGKRGPFTLTAGVKVHCFGEWLLVTKAHFDVADCTPLSPQFKSFTKSEFARLIQAELQSGSLLHAPFWMAFDPEQKHRNVLVASGKDPLWPKMTSQRHVPVIHAQKLLARWKDSSLVLRLAPLWPLQREVTEG